MTQKIRFNWVEKHFKYRFNDLSLLDQALTHKSFSKVNNERLEFLGDSLLSFSISSRLYKIKHQTNEGDLSRFRSELVKGITLANIAKEINLSKYLILGPGASSSGGGNSDSILACAIEAIVGAIYIDGGYDLADKSIGVLFDYRLNQLPNPSVLKDSKTKLQEILQKLDRDLPIYKITKIIGAEHDKHFYVSCQIDNGCLATEGKGSSRRIAEQKAAYEMIMKINNEK